MTDLHRIIIYGAGGMGREILQLVRTILGDDGIGRIAFVDDSVPYGTVLNDCEVLGGAEYIEGLTSPIAVVFGFAASDAKEKVYRRLKKNPNISFPNIIHPSAAVSEYASLGEGIVIAAGCIVSVNALIGNCVFLNNYALIGHDSKIGNFTSVMPMSAISGNVTVGEGCLIGVSSAILQGVKIGSGCTIGMGSIVLSDVNGGMKVFGNPAKRIL
jgi:sugar O-acyltransferase (sialic acid O-acetyltransferase NeuD family)